MYHTQEKRESVLTFPEKCIREDAWLGNGYYFWNDEYDAIQWGHNSKRITGYFEIYDADIDCSNILDTVFNEEEYNFWKEQIDKIADKIKNETSQKPTIKQINQYLSEKADWKNHIDGVLFQDIPSNHPTVVRFFYRKRIQLVAYKDPIITNFRLHSSHQITP